MASTRELVAAALLALVQSALPNAEVKRNVDKPSRAFAGGNVILRDGDPGEPEVMLSPLAYTYEHAFPLEVAAYASENKTREAVLDEMLTAIGAAVEANRTLGGLCEWVEPAAPETDDLETIGAESGRWADAMLVATYTTSNPLY